METTRAYLFWTGPENDVLMLLREPTPLWLGDPVDDEYQFLLLMTIDENEQETGDVAGIKILDFLTFDRWDQIPEVSVLWQIDDRTPTQLPELLKQVQVQYRKEAETLISAD